MSIDVLFAKGTHSYRDDMESFFYVFFWICCGWNAPGEELKEHPLRRWISGRPAEVAFLKRGMVDRNLFESFTLPYMSGYFTEPVRILALQFRNLLFDDRTLSEGMLKNGITECFDDAILKLEEAEGDLEKGFGRLGV